MSYWDSIAMQYQSDADVDVDCSRAKLALAAEGLEKIVFMLEATQSNPVCLAIATHYLELIQDDM